MKRNILATVLLCVFGLVDANAKRIPPKPVPPIISNGVQYSADGDGQDSYVVATDTATGKILWKVRVFHTRVHWWRGEEDNQWLFISDLKLAGDSLLVRDEKNRCYSIQLSTRHHVKRSACDDIFPPQEPRR